MDKSSWLLSPQACPKVEIPMSPHESVRRFTLPSCIGLPPQIDVRQIEAAVAVARFGDRTLAFFDIGEQLERDADAAEIESFDFGHPVLRRAVPIAAAGGAFGLVLAFLLA